MRCRLSRNDSGGIVVSTTALALRNSPCSAGPPTGADRCHPLRRATRTFGKSSISSSAAVSVASRSPKFEPSPNKHVGMDVASR